MTLLFRTWREPEPRLCPCRAFDLRAVSVARRHSRQAQDYSSFFASSAPSPIMCCRMTLHAQDRAWRGGGDRVAELRLGLSRISIHKTRHPQNPSQQEATNKHKARELFRSLVLGRILGFQRLQASAE